MRIARVFPRRTSMTPTDDLAFVDCPPPLLAMPEIDEVHVSVAFTWYMPKAERLAEEWRAAGVPAGWVGQRSTGPAGNSFRACTSKRARRSRAADARIIAGSARCPNGSEDFESFPFMTAGTSSMTISSPALTSTLKRFFRCSSVNRARQSLPEDWKQRFSSRGMQSGCVRFAQSGCISPMIHRTTMNRWCRPGKSCGRRGIRRLAIACAAMCWWGIEGTRLKRRRNA